MPILDYNKNITIFNFQWLAFVNIQRMHAWNIAILIDKMLSTTTLMVNFIIPKHYIFGTHGRSYGIKFLGATAHTKFSYLLIGPINEWIAYTASDITFVPLVRTSLWIVTMHV